MIKDSTQWRVVMALIGALAGLGVKLLMGLSSSDVLPDRVYLALVAFMPAFFVALFMMAGPMSLRRAAMEAGGVAAIATAFLSLAALRFQSVADMPGPQSLMFAYMLLVLLPLPFRLAASGAGWRDYGALFLHAWGIVTRGLTALAFSAVFWLVLTLSHALLRLVGITFIEDIFNTPAISLTLTGAVVGLGVAIANEASDIISPRVMLRFLRLLCPVLLVVLTVFILALPTQGLSEVFGSFSAATVLLVVSVAAATLITVALDADEEEAARLPWVTLSARAISVIMPVPAGLAVWAVVVRVSDYGWTPSRAAAMLASGIALIYAVTYLLSVLWGRGWQTRIRQGNIWLALLVISAAALWQTPLMDVQALSARSQEARIKSSEISEPYRVRFEDWGKAGHAAKERLSELALLPAPPLARPLQETLQIRPAEAEEVRDKFIAGLRPQMRTLWREGCNHTLSDQRPACVLVVGDFMPDVEAPQALFLSEHEGQAMAYGVMLEKGEVTPLSMDSAYSISAGDVAYILDHGAVFAPVRRNALLFEDHSVTLHK
ncbi:DUF4153 domain-containing protein [Falsirhodobacter sp. alg1]|uniref:DUF4153 domain-containing protein n=1 Tax=Falsirhodobacter sp. alg1 TaxID=1472418 RepID=UPI00178CF85A|nr:DUF4153 domain-containing protein [Falsirhodobacter sp. alg1]